MQTVVYADVLFVINAVITFLILITTADLTKIESVKSRYVSGALAGGLLSFIILAPEMHILIVITIRLIISILIILITFRLKNLIQFIKSVAGFFIISFIYGGIVYFLSDCIALPKVYYNNGYAYFDFSAVSLVLITSAVFLCMKVINKILIVKNKTDEIYKVEVNNNGKTISVYALYDTGNSIRDIYNGRPVIIISLNNIESLVEESVYLGITDFFEKNDMEKLPKGIRLIPIKTLSSDKLLPAFTAERAVIVDDTVNIVIEKVCIAITDDTFGTNNYKALLNDAVFRKV